MPRKSRKLGKRDLDSLRRRAETDPAFSAWRADGGQPGLAVQARRGKVEFLFTYRTPGRGGRRRMLIDTFGAITLQQAREIAQKYRGQVAGGVDPQKAKQDEERQAATLGQAIEQYLVDLRERAESGARRGKRSGYTTARNRLHRHVLPVLGGRRLRDLASDDVKRLHRRMKDTPVEANRTLTALSAVFGWADRAELVPVGFNPARHVERYAENGRRRALTREELTALGRALEEAQETGSVPVLKEGKPVKKKGKAVRARVGSAAILCVKILALTGFRRSEVLGQAMRDRRGQREGLRWGDVDLDAGLIHLRDSKTGRQDRVIGRAVVELLRGAKPETATADDPVCQGARPGEPLVNIDKARIALWRAAGIEETPEGRADLHSLRHSFASIGAHVRDGRYAAFVGPLLGHGHQVPRAITLRYIHSDIEALRVAADAIADEIGRVIGIGESAEVLEFPAGGKR